MYEVREEQSNGENISTYAVGLIINLLWVTNLGSSYGTVQNKIKTIHVKSVNR